MECSQQKSKEYITRNIETKNKLTVTRGARGEGEWGKEGKVLSRNMYKVPMDKAKGGKDRRWEVRVGVWGSGGRKMETTLHEQQLKIIK